MSKNYKVLMDLPLPPPDLRRQPGNPMMDSRDMETALEGLLAAGWELVGYGQKTWVSGHVQHWWVFKRVATHG